MVTIYRPANFSWPQGARGADGFVTRSAFMDERPAKLTYDELVSVVAELRSANVQLHSINVELHARVVEFHTRVVEFHTRVELLQRRVGQLEAQLRSRPPGPPSVPWFVKPAVLLKKNRSVLRTAR